MTQIFNIAGYKFITLTDLTVLQASLLAVADQLQLKGTILLSAEGINLSMAGLPEDIAHFLSEMRCDTRFADMTFRESFSESQPFKRLKVKIKKEIITLKQPDVRPEVKTVPAIAPEKFKRWLDEERDMIVLDTRNDYEVQFGTFSGSVNLHINGFSAFPEAVKTLPRNKTIVMHCTGGIRCEKAGEYLLQAGFSDVYQLQGGILNYFAKVGGAHYDGDCFVFDERVALDPQLMASGAVQCQVCLGPIRKGESGCSCCAPSAISSSEEKRKNVWV